MKQILILVAFMCSVHFICAQEYSSKPVNGDSLLREMVNTDAKVRERVLLQLMKIKNRPDARFSSVTKIETFNRLISMTGNAYYVYKGAYLLSKLPVENEILTSSRNILQDKMSSLNQTIGALAYVESNSPDIFKAYFASKPLAEINSMIVEVFTTNKEVREIRRNSLEKLIDLYLKYSESARNGKNPYRESMLSEERYVVPVIIKMYESGQTLPIPVIQILGEIGNGDAFDILLKEYIRKPSDKTAISLGSCLGSLSLKKIFDYGFDDSQLKKLLSTILGSKWKDVKDMNNNAIQTYMINNLISIKEDCKRRSISQGG